MDFTTFLVYFGTFAAFITGVVTFTELFKKLFNVTSKGWMIAISWILSVAGSLVGFWLQLGLFAQYGPITEWTGWLMAGITGICAGVASNGWYDQTFMEKFVKWIWSFIKPKNGSQMINE